MQLGPSLRSGAKFEMLRHTSILCDVVFFGLLLIQVFAFLFILYLFLQFI